MMSKDGRAARGEYWATALLWLIVLAAGGLAVSSLGAGYQLAGLVAYIVLFVMAFITFRRVAVRRAHDLGMPAPSLFRPTMGFRLLLKKGDSAPNEYGPPPTWQRVGIAWALVVGAWMLFIKVAPLVMPARLK